MVQFFKNKIADCQVASEIRARDTNARHKSVDEKNKKIERDVTVFISGNDRFVIQLDASNVLSIKSGEN